MIDSLPSSVVPTSDVTQNAPYALKWGYVFSVTGLYCFFHVMFTQIVIFLHLESGFLLSFFFYSFHLCYLIRIFRHCTLGEEDFDFFSLYKQEPFWESLFAVFYFWVFLFIVAGLCFGIWFFVDCLLYNLPSAGKTLALVVGPCVLVFLLITLPKFIMVTMNAASGRGIYLRYIFRLTKGKTLLITVLGLLSVFGQSMSGYGRTYLSGNLIDFFWLYPLVLLATVCYLPLVCTYASLYAQKGATTSKEGI
ncbi:MAG: hypothetical protein ACK5TR_08665 [Alphaproteobacteria bacterium]|jgi:hypothetical protein|nr:hypothetical protein [Alphaproteobacteria bacterium]